MASGYSLDALLGFAPLTKTLRTTAPIPNRLPKRLFETTPSFRFTGDQAQYIRVKSERKTAQFVPYGAPSKTRDLQPLEEQAVKMLHIREHIQIESSVLTKLRSFERWAQDLGKQWLGHQLMEAGRRIRNSHVVATTTILRYGNIYADQAGNCLPSSSGSVSTFGFNIPATHQNQCNGNISAPWANPLTAIPTDILSLQNFAVQETGLPLVDALYGKNVPRYLFQNAYIQEHIVRYQPMNAQFLESSNMIPKGLLGLNWIYVGDMFIESATTPGSYTALWGNDSVTFMPSLDPVNEDAPDMDDWWVRCEGSILVPTSLQISRNPQVIPQNSREEFGMFAYGIPVLDPFGYAVIYGDTSLQALRNELAIMQAIVAF